MCVVVICADQRSDLNRPCFGRFDNFRKLNEWRQTRNRHVWRTDKQHCVPYTNHHTSTRSGWYSADESNLQCEVFQDPQSIGPGFDLSDRGAQADVLDLTSRSYLKSGQ